MKCSYFVNSSRVKAIGVVLLCVAFSCFEGISEARNYQKSSLTFGMIKKYIVKGETGQSEILHLFGSPNIMTMNKSGEEVWTYDKISMDSSEVGGALGIGAGGAPGGAIVGGAAGISGKKSSSSSRSMTLIITFGDNDIVKDYAVMAQQF